MKKRYDLTGQRFGRLVVIAESEPHVEPSGTKRYRWLCRCDCGNEITAMTCNLRTGHTKSCGCLEKDILHELSLNQEIVQKRAVSKTTHGQSHSRLYAVWNMMRQRCTNPNNDKYKSYGGAFPFVMSGSRLRTFTNGRCHLDMMKMPSIVIARLTG